MRHASENALQVEISDLRRQIRTTTRHQAIAMTLGTVTVWLTVVLPHLL